MSSYLASRQAATAEWARRPVEHHDEHPSSEQPYSHQNVHVRNGFKSPSSFHPAQDIDTQNLPGATSIPQSVQGGSLRQPQSLRPSSNSLQPAEVASPAFSFDDYLTPEFSSSDNFYSEQSVQTTPSIPELKWQEAHSGLHNPDDIDPILYHNTNNVDFDLGDTLHAPFYDFDDKNLGSGTIVKAEPELSTSSTTLSPPDQNQFSHSQANLSVQTSGLQVSSSMAKRSRDQAETDTVPGTSDRAIRSPGGHNKLSMSHAVSPSVLVSTYTRGDSPARSQFPVSRSLSKRSQSSRLGGNLEDPERHTSALSPSLMPPENMGDDHWEEDTGADGMRSGIAPGSRDSGLVMSLKDIDEKRELDESRAGVQHWLETSEAGSPPPADSERPARRTHVKTDRSRSRGTGTRYDSMGLQVYDDSHIPGPGVMIEEASEDDYSEESEGEAVPESPPNQVDTTMPEDGSYFPPVQDEAEEVAPDELEPLPKQFLRRTLWEDPVRMSEPVASKGQPATSNAAIVYFDKQAAQFETASRAATWGTRRLSDSEIASILDGSQFSRHLSLKDTLANRARARGSSIMNSVKNSIPGRSNSFIKKRQQPLSRQQSPDEMVEQTVSPKPDDHRNSTSSISRLHRMSSSSKSKPPKSPPLNTGGAFMAMTSQLAAVGGSSSGTPDPEQSNSLFGTLKRHRSRTESSKSPKPTYGLTQLFTQHGGPPMPVLASPMQVKELTPQIPVTSDQDIDDDADDDEVGVRMDMPMQALNIIPNLDGFRTQVRQLNPRLEPFLVDRIATDQLRRFKKLVKSRAEHLQAIQSNGKCASGSHCQDLGGKATSFLSHANSKDTGANLAQFKVAAGGDSEAEEASFVDGIVTPALFPAGIPLPPTKTLPAEFECFLCFQVKKFQKPSDWTKHVHEDVQPFSCTFAQCPEPKSFKRKADWVRHENERHRHLEWWKCSIQECNHICFRKDNFVQHLVREHKMTEPKSKGPKASGTKARTATSSAQAQASDQTPEEFWNIVQSCRHETTKKPKDEPCKFCNNRCNTWKKLSVHVGKHMEQIAMPVLDLAKNRTVTAETVVSPIDPPHAQNYNTTMLDTAIAGPSDQPPRSPYAASAYSTGHSPAVMQADPQMLASHMSQSPYQPNEGLQPMPSPYTYDQYGGVVNHDYMLTPQTSNYSQAPLPYAVQYQQQIPRSLPSEQSYSVDTSMMAGSYGQATYYQGTSMNEGYVQGYGGPEMNHEGNMGTAVHSGHSSHGHTPVSAVAGNDETAFYRYQQPGPSGQNYYRP